MRNALLISTLFLSAVACDRDTTSSRQAEPIPPPIATSEEPSPRPGERVVAPDTTTPAPPPAATATPEPPATTATPEPPAATATTEPPATTATTEPPATTATTEPPAATATTEPAAATATTEPPATTGATGSTADMAEPHRESVTSSGTYRADTSKTEPVAPTEHAISCEQLIPQAVRRQYLANMTITPTSDPTDIATTCRIEGSGVAEAASVQAWCNPTENDTAMQATAPKTPASANSLGKAAILVDAGELQQLVAWDSDSNCQITIAVPKSVDAVALGRSMLDALPAKSG